MDPLTDRAAIVNTRLNAFRQKLAEVQVDLFVVATYPNAYYLTLFECSNPLLIITPDRCFFLTDSRYTEAAEQLLPPPWELVCRHAPSANEELSNLLHSLGSNKTIGFEETAPYSFYSRLKTSAPENSNIVDAGRLIADLRAIKDSYELDRISTSQSINESVFSSAVAELASLQCSVVSELDLQKRIRVGMAERGVEEAFPTIVAFGANSSRPHACPGANHLNDSQVVLVDMGVRYDHYCSDMTRTLAGPALEKNHKLREIYDVVLEAQAAALEAVRDGVAAREVDRQARDVIRSAGYGDFFGHGLGHGVGLEIHEPPTLNPHSEEILRTGMVITVEPGIYLPGLGGVRIEDLVVVNDSGHTNLTRFSKVWQTLY